MHRTRSFETYWWARTVAICAIALLTCAFSTPLHAQAQTPVADAALAGDLAGVRKLLREGADVNTAQGDGMTALHWAAMNGSRELADVLLHAGAHVTAATRLGASTPLLLAAENGNGAVVVALLAAGADPAVADLTGTTALMLAASAGQIDAIRALIAQGAEVNATEQAMALTPLMFAAAKNRGDAIKALAAAGGDVSATSKVVDLAALSAEGRQGRRGASQPGTPQPVLVPGVDRPFLYNELVGSMGGLTPLHFAARDGHMAAVKALIEAGTDVNQTSPGDNTSPLLIAMINGRFDVAQLLIIEHGADVTLGSEGGVTPLYAVLNVQWAPKSMYPQPRAHLQQKLSYLEMMQLLLDKGADPNVRLKKKVWYSGYNTDMSGVDETGATPFWRAAYASDVDAMRLLVARGADPHIPTVRPPGRPQTGDVAGYRTSVADVSGQPPVPVGGPAVPPLLAAAGVGYGEGFAANTHRYAPSGFLPAIKYLVEEVGADVNAVDHEGNTAVHHAAARGDTESILYLVSKGADVTKVNREGNTTADMANAPVQRVQPFPETLALLMKLGAKNNNKCVSC
ncbi:MAG TPA: ankyrin repeat domain-containing protein [Vicinamibacterales bacterium]|nr:ankyrin repeat domain-containing protein [Vicinamibacterales bacterium]